MADIKEPRYKGMRLSLRPPFRSPQALVEKKSYDVVMHLERQPISHKQLTMEVNNIYQGLVTVEAKCIEVDNKYTALHANGAQSKLSNEQWQSLAALHRTLLYAHYDFFITTQHASASPTSRGLATIHSMSARLWLHGIYSFLESLRYYLPASLDHMLAFIYIAYTMIALLYETVPAFEDTWIEYLGHLGRYRMEIKGNIRDREVWTGIARHWYSKASNRAPTNGHLYHHLAVLSSRDAFRQLFYYAKSLCTVIPFEPARGSILTLFDSILNTGNGQRLSLNTTFVKAHGLLSTNKNIEIFRPSVQQFVSMLDNHIMRVAHRFIKQGYQIAISNSIAILGFASKKNPLVRAMCCSSQIGANIDTDFSLSATSVFIDAQYLSNATFEVILRRIGDPNVLPFIHVTLVFLYYISQNSNAIQLIQVNVPWKSLSIMLNTLLETGTSRIDGVGFSLPESDAARPLPEDFAMQGLLWTDNYYPKAWFMNEELDDEERYRELVSMTIQREERILWLAHRLARAGFGLNYENSKPEFSTQIVIEWGNKHFD